MTTTTTLAELPGLVGQELGTSDWIEVTQERVNILTDMAIEWQHIDESAAEAAIERAKATLAGKHDLTEEEVSPQRQLVDDREVAALFLPRELALEQQ